MKPTRTLTIALAMTTLGCPGDDDGGADGDGSTTRSSSTGASDDDIGVVTSSGSSSSGTPPGTTGGSADSSGGPADSSTGGDPGVVELINDGYGINDEVAFQMGFVQDECWASTYVPEPEHYPFAVVAATMIVGGDDMGGQDFYVGVYSVDGNNQPDVELASGTATISGMNENFDQVPLDVIGASPAPIEMGNFAIVVCMTNHSGFPSISRDDDGLTHADRNWIRLEDGTWVPSSMFAVPGDWIMRATIMPM